MHIPWGDCDQHVPPVQLGCAPGEAGKARILRDGFAPAACKRDLVMLQFENPAQGLAH
jgi:hypothetical protein